jgi:hypothetical protein
MTSKPVDYVTGIQSGRIEARKQWLEEEKERYRNYCEDTYNDIVKTQSENINDQLKALGIYNDLTKAS